jgi:hypothetical protein
MTKDCKNATFEECELAILRMAVDNAQEKMQKRTVQNKDVSDIISVVEQFIRNKKLICYGGTAINNILPVEDQFYNKNVEIPDYDFFSTNALSDAKELADIYYSKGYTDVEAKAGQHYGTYKVFVNYIPVADITSLAMEIYKPLKVDSISVDGIFYASPNFLRMAMYLELSRPAGDTSRWEKVLKRLSLLNKNYPLVAKCDNVQFQRKMSNGEKETEIYESIKTSLINQNVVFFGGHAISLYSQYMPNNLKKKLSNYADFDVLSNNPSQTSTIVMERLKDIGIKNANVKKHNSVGEIVPEHYEIKIGKDSICFVYKTIGCHSYNITENQGQKIKVATIDTMLSFYLAFLYTNRPYYNQFIDRILCMSQYLFEVQQKNRLQQKGLLQRFSITCKGHQHSVTEIRGAKSEKYKELKSNKNKAKEFEEWFLNYKPDENKNKSKNKQKKTTKSKNIKKSTKSNKSRKNKKGTNTKKINAKKTYKKKMKRRAHKQSSKRK